LTRFIGLTGGIGAGKSEVLAAAKRLGAETLSTDEVTHQLLAGEEMRDLLVERWGEEIAPGGTVDRERVAGIVFERPEELGWLESELHPRVGQRVVEWRANLDPGTAIAMVEVPLLFETRLESIFDAVLAVIADDAIRERRLKERGAGGFDQREERQLPQSEKAARADYVLRNDGSLDQLEGELRTVMAQLTDSSRVGT
jgi:dephospho-CoA kinase